MTSLLALRIHPGSPFLTYIPIKQHKGKDEGLPALFVAGIPFGFDKESLEAVFDCFGTVAQIVLHGTEVGFVVALQGICMLD
jgi:hypothetical protein